MKKNYTITGQMTISMYVDVMASSPAEAREKAERASIMSLCHSCARGERGAWSTSGELDGEVQIDAEVEA